MKLNDKYSIEKDGQGFTLIEKTIVNTRKDGKLTGETRDGQSKRFYGTVYQALQGFLSVTVDDSIQKDIDLEDLRMDVYTSLKYIDESNEWIKENFCIEVRKA